MAGAVVFAIILVVFVKYSEPSESPLRSHGGLQAGYADPVLVPLRDKDPLETIREDLLSNVQRILEVKRTCDQTEQLYKETRTIDLQQDLALRTLKNTLDEISIRANAITSPTLTCPSGDGWILNTLSKQCYYYNASQVDTWLNQQDFCQALLPPEEIEMFGAANITSILNSLENFYVAALTGGSEVWIGGTDDVSNGSEGEGQFIWIDGETWAYEKWAGERLDTLKDCVALDGDSWIPEDCAVSLPTVCKVAAMLTPPPPVAATVTAQFFNYLATI